ncbi:MAG: RnfH family protein [Gammaproteobacteria bacterium]
MAVQVTLFSRVHEVDRISSYIQVTVVWAESERVVLKKLEVERGTSAQQVVEQSGVLAELGLELSELGGVGVWGRHLDGKKRLLPHQYQVADGDRIELYRQLALSPREARLNRLAAGKVPN